MAYADTANRVFVAVGTLDDVKRTLDALITTSVWGIHPAASLSKPVRNSPSSRN
jgi:hypothetical protein